MPTLSASPPYRRGVSFDTFDTEDAPFKHFTLSFAHSDYAAASDRRVFLCGIDGTESSDLVLDWALSELVDDGDEVVCVYRVEKESMFTSWSRSKGGRHRIEAEKLLDSVVSKNTRDKVIKVVVEIVGGKTSTVIQSTINLYEPSALVVAAGDGTSSDVQKMLSGSVSNGCWQQPMVPVIVVRAGMARPRRNQQQQQHQHQQQDQGRRWSDQRSLSISHSLSSQDSAVSTQEMAKGTAKVGGQSHRGILKNKHERLFIKNDSGSSDGEADETLGEKGFILPIGFLSTESVPKADLALKSPTIAALEEDWDDDELGISSRKVQQQTVKDRGDDPVVSDDEDGLKPMRIVEERRPSVRETTPWLASILNATEKNPRGHNRKSRANS
ncbi:hypothetical protein PV08_00592 [Exophiala spinifera]|uniref:UspA domain-containing protein n=1 Tax=Exophiala spinifera TaxID=91928 RepID=A0A0D2A5K3_9EURO|nr:uncharacterized protein PV08_00592 [Exophiala spinifera]KIW20017.1 hypothetical protein PV08_00592 [Exophiala spinifera]